MAKVILKAQDLDGYLTPGDKKTIGDMNKRFGKALELFTALADDARVREHDKATEEIIALSNEMGHEMREIVHREPGSMCIHSRPRGKCMVKFRG